LAAIDAVVVARPPTSDFKIRPSADERRAKRKEQRKTAVDVVHTYNPEAVMVTLDSLDGWRDYVDVRDVARAACSAALSTTPVPAIANIGAGKAVQTRERVEHLIAVSQTDARVVLKVDAHAGAVASQCADITTAQSELGWTPAIDLPTYIADTWAARQLRQVE
jgi:nucleoside-diphosphate-sugar epimerase